MRLMAIAVCLTLAVGLFLGGAVLLYVVPGIVPGMWAVMVLVAIGLVASTLNAVYNAAEDRTDARWRSASEAWWAMRRAEKADAARTFEVSEPEEVQP